MNKTNYILTILCTVLFWLFGQYEISAQLHTLNKDLPCINKTFQVHVNVILDAEGNSNFTPEGLQADIDIANKHFKPICADFKICSMDTIYNYEYDSIVSPLEFREMATIFIQENKINLFLASFIKDENTCGLANVNGISNPSSGSIYLKCGGSTLTHELGHLFGLTHTFEGDGNELVNGSNCETTGDKICDTPADPFIQGEDVSLYVDENCLYIYDGTDANGQFYQPDVGNIMSYYPCPCGFTRQQYILMADNYLNSLNKYW